MDFDLTIQIVNYKTKIFLENCLGDLINDLKDSSINFQIKILDNFSGDNLSDLENRYLSEPRIRFYYAPENKGFGAGHNFLVTQSKSKYILILNPDIRFVEKDSILRLLNFIKKDQSIKVVGPQLVNIKNKIQKWDHGELFGLWAYIASKLGRSFYKKREKSIEVSWVSGACFLVEREIFERVGGFDQRFFLYKEEEDFCLRIRQVGGKIFYNPLIKILHFNSVVARKNVYMQESQEYFTEKHIKNWLFYHLSKILNKLKPF